MPALASASAGASVRPLSAFVRVAFYIGYHLNLDPRQFRSPALAAIAPDKRFWQPLPVTASEPAPAHQDGQPLGSNGLGRAWQRPIDLILSIGDI